MDDMSEWEKQMQHELGGPPPRVSADQGIAQMKERIAYLQKSLDEIHPNAGEESEIELIQQLRDARKRLQEYQTQKEGLN